jgi:hypothetical protein
MLFKETNHNTYFRNHMENISTLCGKNENIFSDSIWCGIVCVEIAAIQMNTTHNFNFCYS